MNPVPFSLGAPPPWLPILQPVPPVSSSFWENRNVHDHLRDLQDTIDLAKALQKELEMMVLRKEQDGSVVNADSALTVASVHSFSEVIKTERIDLILQESCSLEAASSLISNLKGLLEPFNVLMSQTSPWEEKSAAVRLANKLQKSQRNKRWRKRKRRQNVELYLKELERFDQADQEADEWRAREIAKDIAKRKVEKMKEIAKLKANEERKRLESELELVLIVEKLQDLRSIRIEKLKKQGHFLPEEDNKFLERVRAAVEEEERQARAAADTDAAKDAIATAEEYRKTIYNHGPDSKYVSNYKGVEEGNEVQLTESENKMASTAATASVSEVQALEGQGYTGAYDSVASLPIEFYHYYHGSNADMGTLIEVRRMWDAYIRPGGSRIPGHWIQPPAPANEIWASYILQPK